MYSVLYMYYMYMYTFWLWLCIHVYARHGIYLSLCGSLGSLCSSGEVALKDKHVSIGSPANHVLVVKGRDQMSHGTVVVVVHVEWPVRGELWERVRLVELVDTNTPIGCTSEKILSSGTVIKLSMVTVTHIHTILYTCILYYTHVCTCTCGIVYTGTCTCICMLYDNTYLLAIT